MPKSEKILFLVPYPLHYAPSQRFRVELYLPLLQEKQLDYKVASFLDEDTYRVLYSRASIWKKSLGVLKGFLRRWKTVLIDVHAYDYVFVHREASPAGPPIFEWIISKLWRKKMIYDFDDAIWIPASSNKIINWFRAYWKIRRICSWSYKVAAGNNFLCNYARQYNRNVVLLPTCVDTLHQHNRLQDHEPGKVVIGWTGSHSTLKYLDPLVPLLEKLVAEHGCELLVICNKPPAFSFPGVVYLPWKEKTEIDDLLQMHIGIMPLHEDAWSEGKCGFKLIQYLALGIPAVATPVGVNKEIIEPGVNGYLCQGSADWEKALYTLITDPSLRKIMGGKGRVKIVAHYSIQANAAVFLGLFN